PADKLRNQAIADQVGGLRLLENFNVAPGGRRRLRVRMEPKGLLPHAPFDNFLEPHKCAAAYEQDVRRVDRREFLVRVLASTLGWDVCDRAFQNLEQRLLHSLARNVAGNRGVLVLLRYLVDLVYVY